MSARALGVIVTGGRHYVLSADDFLLIEGTMRACGAKTIFTDGSAGVADQVEAWAERRGISVSKVTANWMLEGPATPEEHNTSLVELARTVIAFPGEDPTDDLLAKARRRRLRIVESPGRIAAYAGSAGFQPDTQSAPAERTITQIMNSPTSSIVRAEDPDAVQHLQTKIAAAEKLQATMKAANVIIRNRQLTDDEKLARLVAECGQREHSARELLKPDFAGRVGFPDYALTNNGANIRRMQARMKGLANESGRASVTLPFTGGRVEDNAEECRVRIYHEVKPPEGTIVKLRTYGFHWTPSMGCWQRLRNDSARYAATQITGVTWPPVAAVGRSGPSVATANSVAVGQAPRPGIAA